MTGLPNWAQRLQQLQKKIISGLSKLYDDCTSNNTHNKECYTLFNTRVTQLFVHGLNIVFDHLPVAAKDSEFNATSCDARRKVTRHAPLRFPVCRASAFCPNSGARDERFSGRSLFWLNSLVSTRSWMAYTNVKVKQIHEKFKCRLFWMF